MNEVDHISSIIESVATPLWAKCEGEAHTPKSGKLESYGTPKNSELDCKGQISLHWSVIYTVGKVLKCRCPKWPRMSHLDICNPSYGQKKGRESNCQFDSLPVWLPATKSRESTRSRRALRECDTALESSQGDLELWFRPRPDRRSGREVMVVQSPGTPTRDSFGTFCDRCLYCKSLSCTSNLHSCDQIAFYGFNFIHDTTPPRFIYMTHLHCQLHRWTSFGGGWGYET